MANIPPPRYVNSATEAAWRIMGYVFGDGNPPTTGRGLSSNDYATVFGGALVNEAQRCAGVLGWTNNSQWKINNAGHFVVTRAALHAACGIGSTLDFYHGDITGVSIPRLGLQAFLASLFETEGKGATTGFIGIMDESRTPQADYCPRIPAVVALCNQHSLNAVQQGGNSLGCGTAAVPRSTIEAFPLPLLTYGGGESYDRYQGNSLADWPESGPAPDVTPPPVPTGLTALAGDTQVTLSWSAVSATDLDGYRLYRGATLISDQTGVSFVDSGRTNGVLVTYKVSSYDTSGNESAQSAGVSATPTAAPPPPDTTPPLPPTSLTAAPDAGQVLLSWLASSSPDLASYRVYRDGNLITTTTETHYTDQGLVPETAYAYQVFAVDTSSNVSTAASVSTTTLEATVPDEPISVAEVQVTRTLGCMDTAVHIYERGGLVPVRLNLPWTACEWARRVDEYSTAAIELQGLDCFTQYSFIEPRRHELVIEVLTDGVWRRRWAGPIYNISATPAYPGLRVSAHDISWWLTMRLFHSNHTWANGTDLTTVFVDSVNDAMSIDNTPGLVLDAALSGAKVSEEGGSRKVLALSHSYVYDYLTDLGNAALDWTCIDRTITVRGFELTPISLNPLTEQHFVMPTQFTLNGKNCPTRTTVAGAGRGEAGDTIYATALTTDSTVETTYGIAERVISDSSIRDTGSARTAASTHERTFNGRPKWIFQSGELDLQRCPVTLDELIPGRRVPISIGQSGRYPTIQETYRLISVDAYVGPDQNKVSIAVAPLGATEDELSEE